MPDRDGSGANTVNSAVDWYAELGLVQRFPRPPEKEISALMREIEEPKIFLRDKGNNVEIVVSFPLRSQVFPPQMKEQMAKFGLTLSEAFDAVLWKKLETNTAWVELAGTEIEAYRQTWMQLYRLAYLGHYHPSANQWLKTIEQKMTLDRRVGRRGRRPQTQAEAVSLRNRYNTLLTKCRLIHSAATNTVESLGNSVDSYASVHIRKAIWDQVRRHIHGMPGDGYIFSGEAFTNIPYRHGTSKLHDPKSWKPHQLAISLLSFERVQAYQTIEKKILPTKSKSPTRN
ncbi:MAG TPA: hypothetical protein VMP68_14480 [Candidatus Eisenbacteria bacterium]|nr:hypothetical protein [Candidatus Eisenbacteria bacterium]